MKKCPNCGAEVSDNAKFCMQCGSKIPEEISCPKCGANLPSNAKFCLACGSPINRGTTNVRASLDSAIKLYEDEKYSKALPVFLTLADQDPTAKQYLAYCYLYGNGIKEDVPKALELLLQAADNGCHEALSDIACIYMDDDYGLKDISKGIQYFNEAASYNDTCAISNLAEIYAVGYHVNQDWDKSYEYLSRLDDLGVIEKSLLALMYWNGNGVKQDKDKAFKLLEETKGQSLSLSFEYDEEIFIKGDLLYADIHCENLTGNGNFEFGIEIYRFLSSEYDCIEAQEKLEFYRNEDASVIHKYRAGFKSRNGCTYDETKTVLKRVQSAFSIDDLPLTKLSQFSGVNLEKEITVPEGVREIKDRAFSRCEHLERVVLPSSLRIIGKEAFKGCSMLSEAIIPEGVESIGDGAFSGCDHLERIVLPPSLGKFGEEFQREKMLNVLEGKIPSFEPLKLSMRAKLEAFRFLKKFTVFEVSLDIFSRIASILQECENEFLLSQSEIEALVTQQLEIYTYASKNTEITLPSDLTYIASSLFSNLGIESMSFPESVTRIRKDTFRDCKSLETVRIPSCGLTNIDDGAFFGTTGLKNIKLPSSLKSISHQAFSYSGLESICIPESVEEISGYAFKECTSLKQVSVLCPISLLKDYTFDYPLTHFSIGICNKPENAVHLPCSESYYIKGFSPEIGQAIVSATSRISVTQNCKVFVPDDVLDVATDFFKERMARNIILYSDENIIIDDSETLFYTENIKDEQKSIGELLDEKQAEKEALEHMVETANMIASAMKKHQTETETETRNHHSILGSVAAASAGIVGFGIGALGKGLSKGMKSNHDSDRSNKTSSSKHREPLRGSISFKEIPISKNDLGKYKSTSFAGGKVTAKICLVGDAIDPDRTYTDQYCRQHKLGKYSD